MGSPSPEPRRPKGDRELLSVGRFMLRFTLTGLMTLLVVMIITAIVSRNVGQKAALADAVQTGGFAAKGVVEPNLTEDLLLADKNDSRYVAAVEAFDTTVRNVLVQGALVRVKVWRADGTIVYSDEGRLLTRNYPLAQDELNVLKGKILPPDVSDLSEPENEFENKGARLVQLYQLVHTPQPNHTPLLFESYFEAGTIDRAGQKIWREFSPVSLIGLLVLQAIQFPVAYWLARRLRRQQEQRERLLTAAVESVHTERRRIASDLHDGVVQDLTGVSYSLAALGRSPQMSGNAVITIDNAGQTVRDAVAALRSLLVDLYPPDLEANGLSGALVDLQSALQESGLDVHLFVEVLDSELSRESSGLLYRTALEATRNIVTHAKAKEVVLSVSSVGDNVRLAVDDDGVGFDPEVLIDRPNDGHVGLRVLSDLVRDAGGTVKVKSAPGRGTELVVEVPR